MNRVIIVEDTLLTSLQNSIDTLKNDWQAEGANSVYILTHSKGVHLNPQQLKNMYMNIPDIVGVLFLGELPVALLQNQSSKHPFMSDSFFMDIHGTWSVDTNNVVTPIAPQEPTVFVGRVMYAPETGWQQATTGEPMTEIDYYKRYLDKLHNFRTLSRYLLVYGVPYPQDHWSIPPYIRNDFKALMINNFVSSPTDDYSSYLNLFTHLYSEQNIEHHGYVTRDELLQMLKAKPYDCLWVQAHSTPGGHNMAPGSEWNQCDYMQPGIVVNFYFFEACAVASIVWYDQGDPVNPGILKQSSDTMMSNILFSAKGGIATVGASISKAFPHISLFFDNLKICSSFGEAFLKWMTNQYDFSSGNVFNYMNLFGDPFVSFNLLPTRTVCISHTSLYGTPYESKIEQLRKWRDENLSKSKIGKLLIKTFYIFSKLIVKSSIKSKVVRFFGKYFTLCSAWIIGIREKDKLQ